ncbi:helix-turn-helix domain-containing protein [Paludisphaera sp.]|uniref:helix-turn-helix domain-containing protein n=1 Tax=Paludisphaera sp. TaxID=2017432 RepID=UPI00301B837D
MLIREVAELLNRSVGSIRLYCRYEGLPHRREGRAGVLAFDRDEVLAWAERPAVKSMLSFGDAARAGRKAASIGAGGEVARG